LVGLHCGLRFSFHPTTDWMAFALSQSHHRRKSDTVSNAQTAASASEHRVLLSIVLSIDYDIIRHPEGPTTADHAVRQRITDFLPDFLLPCGRVISVRSVVQLYPGP